jgi:hypothetical protein
MKKPTMQELVRQRREQRTKPPEQKSVRPQSHYGKWDDSLYPVMQQMRDNGRKWADIGEHFGRTKEACQAQFRKWNKTMPKTHVMPEPEPMPQPEPEPEPATKPKNHYSRWTDAEVLSVWEMFCDRVPVSEISDATGRTRDSILNKVNAIMCRLHNSKRYGKVRLGQVMTTYRADVEEGWSRLTKIEPDFFQNHFRWAVTPSSTRAAVRPVPVEEVEVIEQEQLTSQPLAEDRFAWLRSLSLMAMALLLGIAASQAGWV